MAEQRFKALVVEGYPDKQGQATGTLQELDQTQLPEGDVLVAVEYSSLNYKDGLAVTGAGKVIRRYPMVPGIDLAGTVLESASPRFQPGQTVVATGWGLGERHWGGYAGLARLQADWLQPLPSPLDTKAAMTIGTAGLTAMLALMALEKQGITAGKDVVVTGAGGGVGSMAVALLANQGYPVIASTGRQELHSYLQALGAGEILDREEVAQPGRPLESETWGGAIDTVGGNTLARLLSGMAFHSSVAACGLAGGSTLQTTVFPFILRGVNLLGIDSNMCPNEVRETAWKRLAVELKPEQLELMTEVIPLQDVPARSREILQGRVRGRIVVQVAD